MDLADDEEMMRMMHDARFESVFLGIETPDESSLETAARFRTPAIHWMQPWTGSRPTASVMAGFIIGFDGEKDVQAIASLIL